MIQEQKRFVITSDILYTFEGLGEYETLEEAERMQTIVTLAEFIYDKYENELSGGDCIDLAKAILIKFDKIKK